MNTNAHMRLFRFVLPVSLACGFLLVDAAYAREPFYRGLGSYPRKVSTDSALAQSYFNQGLAWLHGFNYPAALRSFTEAAKLDPECAMIHWGVALAAGPHFNNIALRSGKSLRRQDKNMLEQRAVESRFRKIWAKRTRTSIAVCANPSN